MASHSEGKLGRWNNWVGGQSSRGKIGWVEQLGMWPVILRENWVGGPSQVKLDRWPAIVRKSRVGGPPRAKLGGWPVIRRKKLVGWTCVSYTG